MKGRSWKFWLLTGVLVVAVGVVGGPFVYIHFIEKKAPAPLALSSPSPSATQTATAANETTGVNGTWTVTSGSAQTVNLSASGLRDGTLNQFEVTAGSGYLDNSHFLSSLIRR